jgi:hypothetical protein
MTPDATGAAVPDFTAQIALGMAWLDEHRPGWAERVNVETLDLGDPCHCVLGQTGDLPDGDSYRSVVSANGLAWGKARAFRGVGDWDALDAQWRTAILARRADVPR